MLIKQRKILTNGIQLNVAEAGKGPQPISPGHPAPRRLPSSQGRRRMTDEEGGEIEGSVTEEENVYSPPARGPLLHLWFLALGPVQGSNVVGSQPVGARFKQSEY